MNKVITQIQQNRNKFLQLITLFLLIISSKLSIAQNPDSLQGTSNNKIISDTNSVKNSVLRDSSSNQKIKKVTQIKKRSSTKIDSKIEYSSEDSMIVDIPKNMVYLYGNAVVIYEDKKIESGVIEIDLEKNLVSAVGIQDSNGNFEQKPVFTDGSSTYYIEEIKYNLSSKKARIKEVKTQQDEGYITGDTLKKQPNNHIHIKGGTYTTCDLDHPHFAFRLSKMVVIPDDKIVTKHGYLEVEGVPTPLVLPFGWFPNSKKATAGILIPAPGVSQEQGFYLTNLGWFQPISWKKKVLQVDGTYKKITVSDMLNTTFFFDIYSRGSFRITNNTQYMVRYKMKGNVNLTYGENKFGSQDFNSLRTTKTFFIKWRHTQDTKAHPNNRFSADINFGSTKNFQQDLNASSTDYKSSNFSSNVNFYQKLGNYSPFSFNISARHSQNASTNDIELILPEFTLNMARITPFSFLRKKNTTGGKKWYEQFGLSYSLNARNTWKTSDTILFNENKALRDELIQESINNDMRYGIKQNATLTGSFKFWKKKFTFNPSINIQDIMFFKETGFNVQQTADGVDTVVSSVYSNFDHQLSGNINLSLTTKLAGLYVFGEGKGSLQKIRHVMTPNVSFNYSPSVPDFEQSYSYFDTLTNSYITEDYNPFQGEVYSPKYPGETGAINFSLVNSIEAKVRDKKDSIKGNKNIKLIENFTLGSGYNFFADSLNWSDLSLTANTKIFDKINVRYSGSYTPYQRIQGRKVDTFQFNSLTEKKLLNMNRTNVNVSFPITNKSKKDLNKSQKLNTYIPFSMNVGYSINLQNQYFSSIESDSLVITQSLTASGDVKLTEKWGIRYSSGYDFINKQLTYTELNFTRDLHCWQLTFRWIPFGPRQSYHLTLRIKASSLSDLKVERKKPWFDN